MNPQKNECHFCRSPVSNIFRHDSIDGAISSYQCPKCGHINLQDETAFALTVPATNPLNDKENRIIGICIRNEFERRGKKHFTTQRTLIDLQHMIETYREPDPLEKLDQALLNLGKASKFIGDDIEVNLEEDQLYYHCRTAGELQSILIFLHKDGFIATDFPEPQYGLSITPKGYERLRELERTGKDSRQCFVAMWLDDQMNGVYKNAIKPAIEYIEDDEVEPRFRALRIDNKEHANDINDEIIAEIRRSRFMVCDLTGYRGGVYFEAGFAYGLGLEVIYTCRKDWVRQEILKSSSNKAIEELMDSNGKTIPVRKEGIHFDLEHRNRIEWEEGEGNLKAFKDNLTKRIQALII